MSIVSLLGRPKVVVMISKLVRADLLVLAELIRAGRITPVFGRCYDWSEVASAFAHVGSGHARGKIVVTVPGER